MPPTIRRLEKQGDSVRYFVHDEDGNELRQVSRPMTADEAAKKTIKALENAVRKFEFNLLSDEIKAEIEARAPVELPTMPEAPIAADHTHIEFGFGVPEHSHSEYENPDFTILEANVGQLGVTLGQVATQLTIHNHTSVPIDVPE